MLVLWSFLLVEASVAAYFLLGLSTTYYRPRYLEPPNDSLQWRTEHHDWGAWHKPSTIAYHVQNCFSVSYRSNSYGARDRERSLSATDRRVIMLGDSFVEGYAVDEEHRVSNLLERHLGREVLNFGSGGYFGPLQYQILYDRLARRFDHELVIIGFVPKNDFTDNDAEFSRKNRRHFARRYRPYYSLDGGVFYPRSRPSPDEPPIFADHKTSSRSENLRRLFWTYGFYTEAFYHVSVRQDPTPSGYLGYFETDMLRISRAVDSILAIKKSAAPRAVMVFFIPDVASWRHLDAHPGSPGESAVAKLRVVLERHGIATIDLLDEFRSRGLKRDALYLACDPHWNDAGHHAAFAVLLPRIREALSTSPSSR